MTSYDFERTFFAYMENLKNTFASKPLVLGGVTSSGGGGGGPPGGFVGSLPQGRITFDLTEDDTTWTIPPSGASLLTNLNRIRYRIKQLEEYKIGVIQEDGVTVLDDTDTLNFSDNFHVESDVGAAKITLSGVVLGSGFSKLSVGTGQPVNPTVGDLWVDTN